MRLTSFAATFFVALSSNPTKVLGGRNPTSQKRYEVWASDQSNSEAGLSAFGIKGGFLWIWDSIDIQAQIAGGKVAESLPCLPSQATGPCNMLDVFPQTLEEYYADDSFTESMLGDLFGFGRLHGVLRDPLQKYVTANFYTTGGGYVGVIDTETKEAIGLFRVTEYSFSTGGSTPVAGRSVHMSFWSEDGNYIIIDNLHGKAIERINVERDAEGTIIGLKFDRSASVTLGKGMSVEKEATYFAGRNAYGNNLLGGIVGDYSYADMGDLTPANRCKENDCGGDDIEQDVGRPNNLPICPVVSQNNFIYATLAGGGTLVLDPIQTPMKIVGEYANTQLYGAGCGGIQADGKVFLNAGVAGSGAGLGQSMFAVFAFSDSDFADARDNGYTTPYEAGLPEPDLVYQDTVTNTKTLGNQVGIDTPEVGGQVPEVTTRRDSHGAAVSHGGKYVHIVDRIQNVVEVFESSTYERFTYDLTSAPSINAVNIREREGMGPPRTRAPACEAFGIMDDDSFPANDPAPDLFDSTPDGKYMMVAFRGPAPVTVGHAAQGSCPGVGVVELNPEGNLGRLVTVLRSTNTLLDLNPIVSPSGGADYHGRERSDIHGAIVVTK